MLNKDNKYERDNVCGVALVVNIILTACILVSAHYKIDILYAVYMYAAVAFIYISMLVYSYKIYSLEKKYEFKLLKMDNYTNIKSQKGSSDEKN